MISYIKSKEFEEREDFIELMNDELMKNETDLAMGLMSKEDVLENRKLIELMLEVYQIGVEIGRKEMV